MKKIVILTLLIVFVVGCSTSKKVADKSSKSDTEKRKDAPKLRPWMEDPKQKILAGDTTILFYNSEEINGKIVFLKDPDFSVEEGTSLRVDSSYVFETKVPPNTPGYLDYFKLRAGKKDTVFVYFDKEQKELFTYPFVRQGDGTYSLFEKSKVPFVFNGAGGNVFATSRNECILLGSSQKKEIEITKTIIAAGVKK